ncbi:helix-turn-helix transcriptional regulator [Pedobacter polaris]|uniref:Helix-turn-helix transcriptional regulator n=1 Tax=Pedobacter polaris TaxID=2571273 RepID=A0A4U1CP37_9SPHI|nr:helix-turn-helix transcriptional regulator [Pedobacter polaris]
MYFKLNTREIEVAKLIIEGKKYKEIADILFLSERTLTTHAAAIFNKVNVKK